MGFEKAVNELEPKNKELINLRETLQKKIDDWHIKNKGNEIKLDEYKNFLLEIGYLKKEGPDFFFFSENVDDEITKIAGPQLVVPIMNARYALNAANARWMSLYDSLYGTDVIEQSEDSVSERYDPLRGEMVIKYARDFLDKYFPLKNLSWNKITSIAVKKGKLKTLKGADIFDLTEEQKFIGHRGEADNPSAIILKNNNLHHRYHRQPCLRKTPDCRCNNVVHSDRSSTPGLWNKRHCCLDLRGHQGILLQDCSKHLCFESLDGDACDEEAVGDDGELAV